MKKYLLEKWWFPLLLFVLSILQFILFPILPNTDFSIIFVVLSGLTLFASSIWQLFKGSKIIGISLLAVLVMPILISGSMIYLFSEMMNSLDRGLYLESIEPVIKEKTDLIIPKKYEILENSRRNEDRDGYGIGLIIKYQESEEKYITEQILNSMDSKSDKGIWRYYENGFDFEHSENENNRAQPYYSKVDTLSNTIELYIMNWVDRSNW